MAEGHGSHVSLRWEPTQGSLLKSVCGGRAARSRLFALLGPAPRGRESGSISAHHALTAWRRKERDMPEQLLIFLLFANELRTRAEEILV